MKSAFTAVGMSTLTCLLSVSCASKAPTGMIGTWQTKETPGLICQFNSDGTYQDVLKLEAGPTVTVRGKYSVQGNIFNGGPPDISISTGKDMSNTQLLLMDALIKRTNPPKASIAWTSNDEFTLTSWNAIRASNEIVTWQRNVVSHHAESGGADPDTLGLVLQWVDDATAGTNGGPPTPGDERKRFANGDFIWLRPERIVTAEMLVDARATTDVMGNPAVEVRLSDEGKQKLAAATKWNVGRRLAIVVDGVVLVAPEVHSELPSGVVIINGGLTTDKAASLVKSLMTRR